MGAGIDWVVTIGAGVAGVAGCEISGANAEVACAGVFSTVVVWVVTVTTDDCGCGGGVVVLTTLTLVGLGAGLVTTTGVAGSAGTSFSLLAQGLGELARQAQGY